MKLTYKELKQQLNSLTEEQLNLHVTVLIKFDDEYLACEKLKITESCNILDADHPYLITE